jgi:arsenate-mycothiol transferase
MSGPRVVFVCSRNGGKSQMAAALFRSLVEGRVEVDSAGTAPGTDLNTESVAALAEVGIDISDRSPQPLTEAMIRDADLVVVLGREAQVEPVDGTPVEIWDTDEPSLRGIEGMPRMRLIRDDIAARADELARRLTQS